MKETTISMAAERLDDALRGWEPDDRGAAVLEAAREVVKLARRPRRGERCLDPEKVYRTMIDAVHESVEEFHLVLLDVRGRLVETVLIARGSISQCPVAPRDVLRVAIRSGAHSVVFVHNHPSGDPSPSADDMDLTDRLRAAADLVGVLVRDHVIVAEDGYYSFVEAGRWRR